MEQQDFENKEVAWSAYHNEKSDKVNDDLTIKCVNLAFKKRRQNKSCNTEI